MNIVKNFFACSFELGDTLPSEFIDHDEPTRMEGGTPCLQSGILNKTGILNKISEPAAPGCFSWKKIQDLQTFSLSWNFPFENIRQLLVSFDNGNQKENDGPVVVLILNIIKKNQWVDSLSEVLKDLATFGTTQPLSFYVTTDGSFYFGFFFDENAFMHLKNTKQRFMSDFFDLFACSHKASLAFRIALFTNLKLHEQYIPIKEPKSNQQGGYMKWVVNKLDDVKNYFIADDASKIEIPSILVGAYPIRQKQTRTITSFFLRKWIEQKNFNIQLKDIEAMIYRYASPYDPNIHPDNPKDLKEQYFERSSYPELYPKLSNDNCEEQSFGRACHPTT